MRFGVKDRFEDHAGSFVMFIAGRGNLALCISYRHASAAPKDGQQRFETKDRLMEFRGLKFFQPPNRCETKIFPRPGVVAIAIVYFAVMFLAFANRLICFRPGHHRRGRCSSKDNSVRERRIGNLEAQSRRRREQGNADIYVLRFMATQTALTLGPLPRAEM